MDNDLHIRFENLEQMFIKHLNEHQDVGKVEGTQMTDIEIPINIGIGMDINDFMKGYTKKDGPLLPAYCGFVCGANDIRETEKWKELFGDVMKNYDGIYWLHHFVIGYALGIGHGSLLETLVK